MATNARSSPQSRGIELEEPAGLSTTSADVTSAASTSTPHVHLSTFIPTLPANMFPSSLRHPNDIDLDSEEEYEEGDEPHDENGGENAEGAGQRELEAENPVDDVDGAGDRDSRPRTREISEHLEATEVDQRLASTVVPSSSHFMGDSMPSAADSLASASSAFLSSSSFLSSFGSLASAVNLPPASSPLGLTAMSGPAATTAAFVSVLDGADLPDSVLPHKSLYPHVGYAFSQP